MKVTGGGPVTVVTDHRWRCWDHSAAEPLCLCAARRPAIMRRGAGSSVTRFDMPIEVKVGPPVLTINQGSTFIVTDERGEIDPESEQGVFAGDTRFVSFHRLFIN